MNRTCGARPRRALFWLLAPALAAGLGCPRREPPPRTYPARGTVIVKGGKPLAGGSVHFAPTADPTFSAAGDLGDDGTFTLATVKGRARLPGAPEGEYRVTVSPQSPPGGSTLLPVSLPNTFRVEPKENELRIEIPPPEVRPPRR